MGSQPPVGYESYVKKDPYDTPFQRRINVVLLLVTIVIFALFVVSPRKSHGNANQTQPGPSGQITTSHVEVSK